MINENIRAILESGLLSKWELDSIKIGRKKVSGEGGGGHGSGPQIKLSVEHVEGAFILVIIGLSISLIVFLLEMLVSHMIRRRKYEKVLRKVEKVLCYA